MANASEIGLGYLELARTYIRQNPKVTTLEGIQVRRGMLKMMEEDLQSLVSRIGQPADDDEAREALEQALLRGEGRGGGRRRASLWV